MQTLSDINFDEKNGFAFIPGMVYTKNNINELSLSNFQKEFNDSLVPDGVRNRSYLKLKWERESNKINVAKNQSYYQSAASNCDDGGKIREFSQINPKILTSPVLQSILEKNTAVIRGFEPLKEHKDLTIGIHFIQYQVQENKASYSSPTGLHIDDEPLVFVHLITLTRNAIGGNNLIANSHDKEITHVIRLENPLDTICLSRDVYHAVTPLGSTSGEAFRDVILFTVEPGSTQI